MQNKSTAYILVKSLNLIYHFTGVISITHTLSLKISDKTDTTEQESSVNGAKNDPDKVTLSVVETDAAHSAQGWAERMLDVLASVKRQRLLCRVVTPHHTYDNMLLSSVTATQDETSPDGWSGELTFTECLSVSAEKTTKTDDNASKATNTGSAAPPNKVTGEVRKAAEEAAAATAAAAQKSRGSLVSSVLSVASGNTLGMKMIGSGMNPNMIKSVSCVQ